MKPTGAHTQIMEEEEIDADSHMLTPRADSSMRGKQHGKFFGIYGESNMSDQMSCVRHRGG